MTTYTPIKSVATSLMTKPTKSVATTLMTKEEKGEALPSELRWDYDGMTSSEMDARMTELFAPNAQLNGFTIPTTFPISPKLQIKATANPGYCVAKNGAWF